MESSAVLRERLRYADRRRQGSLTQQTKRVIWKSKSRFIA